MPDGQDSLEARCAAHAPMEVVGRFTAGTVFGDWRVTALIGRGGNGEVYCAEHVTLGTPAAVKVLTREEERAKARFEREARLLAQLKSDAFPQFYAYGEANGTAYLAMELLEPGDLPTDDKSVARFLLKVCNAVAELHALGLVHRDIKPGNILWRKVGSRVLRDSGRASLPCREPVLADLGLVKDINHRNAQPLNEQATLGGVGTPGYGAPEQMERGEVSCAADIHALGVLADRCFGGKPSRVWTRIIQRATSSIPAHRYPSVAAFARAIRYRNVLRKMVPVLLGTSLCIGVIACVFALRLSASRQAVDVYPAESGQMIWPSFASKYDDWEAVTDEARLFCSRALFLKRRIEDYEKYKIDYASGRRYDGDIGRKKFKAVVEREFREMRQQWEVAKKKHDEKIREWKEQVVGSNVSVKEIPVVYQNLRTWVDGLLKSTLYFACLQL